MKKLKTLSMGVVLTLMLAANTFAGIMDCPAVPPAPPPASSSAPEPGTIDCPKATTEPGVASSSVTEITLNLLQSLLSVF